MKNFSMAMNVILLIAVGFLYYRQFSGKDAERPQTGKEAAETQAAEPYVTDISSIPKGVPIAFINADTLFAKYEYAKKAKALSESKMESLQRNYQQKVQKFQEDVNDYMEKAQKGLYTKEQGMAMEADLEKRRTEIMNMEKNHDKALDELDNTSLDVQKKINDFLKKFNREHSYYCTLAYTQTGSAVLGVNDSLDVTKIVVDGLNAEYKAEKK